MSVLVIAFIVAAAVLAPLFGADTRDGRDWRPATPWTPDEGHEDVRTIGSRERASSARVRVASAR